MEDPRIWDDPKRAQELGREKKSLEDIVLVLEAVDNGINDGRELFAMGKDDKTRTPCFRWKPTTPAGSGSLETLPPANSAFTCEAKRKVQPSFAV